MSQCKSCGAEIVWQKMPSGKSMPVDPGFFVVFPGLLRCASETVVTLDGVVVTGPGAEILSWDSPRLREHRGRRSHFATCPNAKQHRKPR